VKLNELLLVESQLFVSVFSYKFLYVAVSVHITEPSISLFFFDNKIQTVYQCLDSFLLHPPQTGKYIQPGFGLNKGILNQIFCAIMIHII